MILGVGSLFQGDEATGEVKWDVQAHAGGNLGATAAMSPDGSLVASVGKLDQHWKLWDAVNLAVHRVGGTHDGSGACICQVPDLGHPLVVQAGCPVLAHKAVIIALAFSPCGQRLATGGADRRVILWDARTGQAEHRMPGHSDIVTTLSFSADGARLASGSRDLSVRIWDATSGALLRTILDPVELSLFRVQFSPTSNRMLATAGLVQLALYDVGSGEKIRRFRGRTFAAFSPDGQTIATAAASTAREVHLVNVETGVLVSRMVGHTK